MFFIYVYLTLHIYSLFLFFLSFPLHIFVFHANGKQKKAGVAILISEKIGLKIKITRDKEGHYIMIKGSIQEENITIVNIYATNRGAPQYITDIKGETDSNRIIIGDFNTPLTPMDRSSKQKINKETQV